MLRTQPLIAHGVLVLLLACSRGSTIDSDQVDRPANFKLSSAPTGTRGELLEATHLASLSKDELDARFQTLKVSARNGVHIYKINYLTQTPDPQPTSIEASGIIVVPDAEQPVYPWLSLQHGTTAGKADAPSVTPSEGIIEASQGFVTLVTDYIGAGASSEVFHPYIVAQAYSDNGVDMLRAVRDYASKNQIKLGPLFLKGYSEGGYATMALQRTLETQFPSEFPLLASAAGAGPYDMRLASTKLLSKADIHPVNTPFVVLSYNRWLPRGSFDLSKVFQPDPAKVQKLFSGAYRNADVTNNLPQKTLELYQPALVNDILSANPSSPEAKQLLAWFDSQSLHNKGWVPKTQTRLYHCQDDEEVPVEATTAAVESFKQLKPDAPVVPIIIPSVPGAQPYKHTTCPGIFAPLQWFGEILAQARVK